MIKSKTIFVILSHSIASAILHTNRNIDACPYKWMCANTTVQTNECIDKKQRMKITSKRNTKMHKNEAKMYFALLLHTIFFAFCAFRSASRDDIRIKTAYNLHQTSESIHFIHNASNRMHFFCFSRKRKII